MKSEEPAFLRNYLYHRREPEERLRKAYHAAAVRGRDPSSTLELILITGSSGTGKTTLARCLSRTVSDDGGFFICGKSEQLNTSERPYSPFVEAFSHFASLVKDRGPDCARSMKTAIHEKIVSEISLLTATIPALTEILGEEKETEREHILSREPTNAQVAVVLTKFLQAVTSQERLLVILLDDLQWMDMESLELFKALACSRHIEGLVLLGTCRGDEVDISDPLSATLRNIEANEILINNIVLSNFSRNETEGMVADLFLMSEGAVADFADLLYRLTSGNIFLIRQHLITFYGKEIISREQDSEKYTVETAKISGTDGGLEDLVSIRLRTLPTKAVDALEILSCIGSKIYDSIAHVLLSPDKYRALVFAEEKGFVAFEDSDGTILFLHDQIRHAVYSTIPARRKVEMHSKIGKTLLAKLSIDKTRQHIFLVMTQLRMGIEIIQNQQERNQVAVLCLEAGRKAGSTSAYRMVLDYLNLGISLLDESHWVTEYDLSLALVVCAAEAEYLNANFEGTEALLKEILENAGSFADRLQAYTIRVYSLGTQGDIRAAIETGLSALHAQGHSFPSKPNKLSFVIELARVKWLVERKTNDEIFNLPQVTDADILALMRMLNVVVLYTYLGKPEITLFVAARSICFTMKHGVSAMSAYSFAVYGAFVSALGNQKEGYRMGQLALHILRRYSVKQWLPRTFVCIYSVINVWHEPISECVEPLLYAHRAALETGDIEMSMLNAHTYIVMSFSAGRQISSLLGIMSRVRTLALSYKQNGILPLLESKFQEVLNLSGRSEDVFVLTGDVMDQELALKQAQRNRNWLVHYAISCWKCEIACFMLDYERAMKCAETCRRVQKKRMDDLWSYTMLFYEALAALVLAQQENNYPRKFFDA